MMTVARCSEHLILMRVVALFNSSSFYVELLRSFSFINRNLFTDIVLDQIYQGQIILVIRAAFYITVLNLVFTTFIYIKLITVF